MGDIREEIWQAVKGNRMRTVLTGVGIAWGLFILIVLVGLGKGFEDGVFKLFKGFSQSTVYVFAATTTMEYQGLAAGQSLFFTEADLTYLRRNVPEVELLSPEVGQQCSVTHDRGHIAYSYSVKGVAPSYFRLRLLEIDRGRALNPRDNSEIRKVALIGSNVAETLFDKRSPVGQTIQIQNESFTVVGVIADNLQNQSEAQLIYLPYQVFTTYINTDPRIHSMVISLYQAASLQHTKTKIRNFLNHRLRIHPRDEKALYLNSMEEQIKAFKGLFGTIHKFLWFLGISTLLSGIIGVANIMYVSAKERTHEIGIRKAVGAKPNAIKLMFIYESVLITAIAGYVGLLLGITTLWAIGQFIDPDTLIMEKPSIDMLTAILATLLLIISGTLAGLKPAAYAANLNPIEALKEE